MANYIAIKKKRLSLHQQGNSCYFIFTQEKLPSTVIYLALDNCRILNEIFCLQGGVPILHLVDTDGRPQAFFSIAPFFELPIIPSPVLCLCMCALPSHFPCSHLTIISQCLLSSCVCPWSHLVSEVSPFGVSPLMANCLRSDSQVEPIRLSCYLFIKVCLQLLCHKDQHLCFCDVNTSQVSSPVQRDK